VGRSGQRGDEWRVTPDVAGWRLDKFLAEDGRLASRARALAAIRRGKVFLNDREASPDDAAVRLSTGDRVRVWIDRPGTSKSGFRPRRAGPLEILYEDATLLVINKPAGILVVPLPRRDSAPTVYDQVQQHLRPRGKRRPLVVHRIDRDTSGLVVFAKDGAAQERLKVQFRRREPERVYLAVVYGHPAPSSGTWSDRLFWDRRSLIQKQTFASDPKGKEAISQYRVIERFDEASLIEVRLVTGKRNQIRLQARLRGHTLVGEQRYVYGPDDIRSIDFPRQALHAWRLGFRHPDDGRELLFEAPPPDDMEELIQRLRRRRP
jgi:23S rRNA pseudouridine1911/1915/1917 synthase